MEYLNHTWSTRLHAHRSKFDSVFITMESAKTASRLLFSIMTVGQLPEAILKTGKFSLSLD